MSLRAALDGLRAALAFYTRLPLAPPAGQPDRPFSLAQAGWSVPCAGVVVGTGGALALVLAERLGLNPLGASLTALGTLAALTGALHEDGLADCADGFGGGRTVADKLAIMRDSRLGTYGVLSLMFSVGLRAVTLSQGATRGELASAAALILAGAASRTATLWPLAHLPPARADGSGASAGRPGRRSLAQAVATTIGVAVAAGCILGGVTVIVALVLAGGATLAFTNLARQQIGGQTGDVAGAVQQGCELAIFFAFAVA